MFFRARRALHRAWFNLNCRDLLKTKPLPPSDCPLTAVTMLCHGEVLMYLLAVKSFAHRLGRSPEIVVLNDGSLDPRDLATLRAHIVSLTVVPIESVSTGSCPRGSCWERLMLISDLGEGEGEGEAGARKERQDGSKGNFIVQLDSDTLTLGPIPEVIAAIEANRSFTLLGDRSYPQVEPMLEACARAKTSTSSQVQAVCERGFDQLPEAAELKYLRGNAGFVGFAGGSLTRERIAWFSDRMRHLAGAQWDEWGSEQLTSNLLIANPARADDPAPLPLPPPRYVSYWAHPEIPYESSSFIHFIGPYRFAHGLYLRSAKRVLAELG